MSSEHTIPSLFAIALWIAILLELVGLAGAGLAKFMAPATWQEMFIGWGYPSWGVWVVGALELAGGLCLLIRPLRTVAAGTLLVIMVGAFVTVITNETQLSTGLPILHAALLTFIIWRARRSGPAMRSEVTS